MIIASTGDPERIALLTTDAEGEAELELETERGDALPLRATSVTQLAGLEVRVLDMDGQVVAMTTVPEPGLVHSTAGDGEGGGAGLPAAIPFFEMRGEFDASFLRGDSNADRGVDVADALHTLNHLFLGGDRPPCLDAADSNDDGKVELTDSVQTLTFLFLGGPGLPAPGSFLPGFDVTADQLYCLDTP